MAVFFFKTADGNTVENEGENMSTADVAQLRKISFQKANANKALGSVTKMVRNGNRVVFDTFRVIRREQDDEVHIVAPKKRWSVRCGHDGG